MPDQLKFSLYLTHRSKLVDYATPIVGSRDQAEDIVQEAFLRFLPGKSMAGGAEQPLAYLYRIVRNHALDLLRRNKMEARRLSDAPDYWAAPQAQATPEQAMLHADDLRSVAKVLESLPNHVRIAVEMHRFGGYKLEEIADHLGMSVPTVHRMIRKALVQIAGQLQSQG